MDRVIDSKDRMWFVKLLETCMKYCFCGMDLQGGGGTMQPGGGHTATHGNPLYGKPIYSDHCLRQPLVTALLLYKMT